VNPRRIIPLLLVLACVNALATPLKPTSQPVRAAAATRDTADLWRFNDAGLQSGLERVLRKQGLLDDARAGRLAVAVADITSLDRPRVASVNGDEMMYAASLPKIAILLGAFRKAQRQGREFSPRLRDDVERMIRYSSNDAATRVLGWVGREDLLALLQSPDLRLYDPTRNGGLWVGKDYAAGSAFHRDPLHNLSHGATAMQVARFFYMLEAGQLVDAEHSARMKAALGNPGISHKLFKGLASRPGAKVYRKSGTWKQFHSDGALVESAGRRMVLVVLAQDPHGGDWIVDLAAPLHDLVLATGTTTGDSRLAHNRAH
jgi:beta-lactamase class A